MKIDIRISLIFLIGFTAFGNTHASTEIENAISPDEKWELTMKAKAEEFRGKVFLKNRANGKILASFDVEEFAANDVRDTITAHWRNDSAAVALNITKGRNISDCEILVFANREWKRLLWPMGELKKIGERNNEKGGKSQHYLTFDSWLAGGVQISYQGNLNEEDLEFRIVPGAQPRLKVAKTIAPAEANYNRGNTKEDEGDVDGAISDYTSAIELDPRCFRCYYNRGTAKDNGDDFDGAIADYTRAIELNPRCARCYHNRGGCYFKKKQYDAAINDLQKAIELAPKDGDSYFALAWYQLFNRKPRETIAASLKALKLSPGDAVLTKTHLAHGYLFDNQFEKAKAIYLENRNAKIDDEQTFSQAVLDDFKKLEAAGVTHPDMEKIKALLATKPEP